MALALAWLGIVSLAIIACMGGPGVIFSLTNQKAEPTTLFVPPTLQVTPTAAPAPIAQNAILQQPTDPPAPDCSNNLLYISDMSIPDGTQVKPGERLDKRWEVENSGTCNWDQSYRLKLVAGSEMGVPAEQALYPARGGSKAVIRIVFTAPQEPGTYRSAWQAYDPGGNPFGDPFYIEVVVQ